MPVRSRNKSHSMNFNGHSHINNFFCNTKIEIALKKSHFFFFRFQQLLAQHDRNSCTKSRSQCSEKKEATISTLFNLQGTKRCSRCNRCAIEQNDCSSSMRMTWHKNTTSSPKSLNSMESIQSRFTVVYFNLELLNDFQSGWLHEVIVITLMAFWCVLNEYS